MSLIDERLEKFKGIDGFVGAALFTPEGEPLAVLQPSGKEIVALGKIGGVVNDVLANAQRTTWGMEIGKGEGVHIGADTAHVIMRSFNEADDPLATESGKVHIHLAVVVKPGSGVGVAKITAKSVIETIAADLKELL